MKKNKTNNEKTTKNKKDKKESTWEFIRSMVILIGIVVLIKWFVCDIFFIPSGSMEQTLHGHPKNGDRIFCTKINYLWRNPKRWEVFVFKFPYEQTINGNNSMYKGEHFIKRCVGLPGEAIALAGGDVFVKDKEDNSDAIRQVKTNNIQQAIWLPVYNENFDQISKDDFSYYWQVSPAKAQQEYSIKKHSLHINTANNSNITFKFRPQTRFGELPGIPDRYTRRQVVDFSCPVIGCKGKFRKTITSPQITARCPECGEYLTEADVTHYGYRTGYPANYAAAFKEKNINIKNPDFRADWWHFVPDLAIKSKVTFKTSKSELITEIKTDQTTYKAIFNPEKKIQVFKNKKLLGEFKTELTTNKEYSLYFYHLDGQVRGYIDNKEIFSLQADPEKLSGNIVNPESTGIELSVKNKLIISSLTIKRDIYYYNYRDNRGFFQLPNDGYMALGDNCPASNDSRFWGAVPQSHLVGTAQFIWWPLNAIKMIH